MRRAHRELSAAVGAATIAAVKAGTWDGVVSECASCRMQIATQTGARVLHPLQLLLQ